MDAGTQVAETVTTVRCAGRRLQEITMKRGKRIAAGALTLVLLTSLAACEGMSRQGRNTAIGAGVGAAGGAVLTGGSAVGTLGGAAIGGVVGHEASK